MLGLARGALGRRNRGAQLEIFLQARWYHPLFKLQKELHRESIVNPSGFWDQAARDIDCQTPYTKVYDKTNDLWFPGARLNVAHNALDRHVARGIVALIQASH